jgi:hypothetical protein
MDIAHSEVGCGQTHTHSDDLQRGTQVDPYTADAGLPATGPLAGGVVTSAGGTAAVA